MPAATPIRSEVPAACDQSPYQPSGHFRQHCHRRVQRHPARDRHQGEGSPVREDRAREVPARLVPDSTSSHRRPARGPLLRWAPSPILRVNATRGQRRVVDASSGHLGQEIRSFTHAGKLPQSPKCVGYGDSPGSGGSTALPGVAFAVFSISSTIARKSGRERIDSKVGSCSKETTVCLPLKNPAAWA